VIDNTSNDDKYNDSTIIKDILGWDVYNWNKALKFFNKTLSDKKITISGKTCLEVGAGFNGGLSLWLALQGGNVLCTSFHDKYVDASKQAKVIHNYYKVNDLITYKQLDIRKLDAVNEYDVVVMKSVLGGVNRNENYFDTAKEIVERMYRALKPGGVLLIVENLKATIGHEYFRSKYSSGKNRWKYFSAYEFRELFSEYIFDAMNFGVLACFGRSELQRNILGRIDSIVEKVTPQDIRYIGAAVVFKEQHEQ
jgi:2-polyprenyl-3-methyl-5-hydroxy-6-metoxy-1,4-benzoquinol methylase